MTKLPQSCSPYVPEDYPPASSGVLRIAPGTDIWQQTRPKLAQTRPTSAKLGRCWPNLAPNWAMLGHFGLILALWSLEAGRTLAEVCPPLGTHARSADAQPRWSISGQMSAPGASLGVGLPRGSAPMRRPEITMDGSSRGAVSKRGVIGLDDPPFGGRLHSPSGGAKMDDGPPPPPNGRRGHPGPQISDYARQTLQC